MGGTICKSCFREIPDGEQWHYRYNERAGLLEPVHDNCSPKPVYLIHLSGFSCKCLLKASAESKTIPHLHSILPTPRPCPIARPVARSCFVKSSVITSPKNLFSTLPCGT